MKKPLMLIALSLSLIACGGGSGSGNDSSSNDDSNPPTGTDVLISGGSPDDPKSIVINEEHEISNNVFFNYFKYSAKADEKVFFYSSLTIPLSDRDKSRCSSAPANYNTQIIAYDSNGETVHLVCGEYMNFTATETEQYTFYFNYPSNGSGVFNTTSVIGNSAISNPSGKLGSPSNPIQMISLENNIITSNPFYNYYKFTANKDDKILINVLLNQPLSATQKSRCSSSQPNDPAAPSPYETQIHAYSSNHTRVGGICGENLTFTFPESGTYIFQFNYAAQSLGTFNAALVN